MNSIYKRLLCYILLRTMTQIHIFISHVTFVDLGSDSNSGLETSGPDWGVSWSFQGKTVTVAKTKCKFEFALFFFVFFFV
jgi:hypothetical protein